MKVLFNDTKSPTHTIVFLESAIAVKENSNVYQRCSAMATQWVDLLTVIIKNVEKEEVKKQQDSSQEISITSIADELKKLSELAEQRILTEDEFEQQKRKLLHVGKSN